MTLIVQGLIWPICHDSERRQAILVCGEWGDLGINVSFLENYLILIYARCSIPLRNILLKRTYCSIVAVCQSFTYMIVLSTQENPLWHNGNEMGGCSLIKVSFVALWKISQADKISSLPIQIFVSLVCLTVIKPHTQVLSFSQSLNQKSHDLLFPKWI